MKKILSAIFLFMCLFAFCGTSVQAEVLLNDDFADSVTNSLPLKAHVIGDGSVVMAQNNGEGNKELVLKNRWEETLVYYDASKVAGTQFVVEAKIKAADNNSQKQLLQISDGGEWVTLATRTTAGKLLDCTGADTGKTLSTGRYYTVSAAVNTSKNLCTLYLDGAAVSSEKIYSNRFTKISKIAFSSAANSSAETAIYYDYIRIYSGLSLIDASTVASSEYCNIVKKNFRDTVIQKTEKPKTVYNMDFDSYHTNDSLSGIDKSANPQNQIIVTENSTGNHYLSLGENVQTNVLMWYYGGDIYPDAVIQADYKIGSSNTGNVDFLLRDIYDTGGEYYPIYIDKNGNFYYQKKKSWILGSYYENVKIGNVSCKEKWVNVAVALHFRTKKLDIYIDGTLAVSDVDFKFPEMSHNLYHLRYRTSSAGANARFDIDNLWVYKAEKYYSTETLEGVGGQKLKEKEEWEFPIDDSEIVPDMSNFTKCEETPLNNPTERLTDYSEVKTLYSGAVCFAQNTANMWIKNGKYDSHYKVLRDGDSLLAASSVLAALAGESAKISDDKNTVTIGNMTASVGDFFINVDGKTVETKAAVKSLGDMIYLPVEEFAIHVMQKWYGFSKLGFAVIANSEKDIHFEIDSNRPYLYTVDNSTHMMAYLIMQQPNAEKLQRIFNQQNNTQRPYCAATEKEFLEIEKLLEDDSYIQSYSHTVQLVANGLLKSTYESKDEPGVQSAPVFSTREPLALYWAYRISGDLRYKDKAEELALQMANLSHWCGDFNFLQTAQAMTSAAYFYDLFYNDFKSSTKDALANAIINNGLIPAQNYYNGSTTGLHNDWCIRSTNWNNIPNNAAMIASMAILGEGYNDDLCLETLERAFVSLGYFMHYYAPDGGGGESIGYTNYTLAYLLPAIDSLERVFGTNFGITDYPGFWETGRFIANASTYNYSYTLNDDSAEGIIDHSTSLWFAQKMNDEALAKYIMEFLDANPSKKSSACVTVLKNYLPFDEDNAGELPLDSLYSEAGLAFSKSNHGDKGVFLGVHSGYNNIAHGRYDFGTFEFDAFGIRFANEVGYEGYEPTGYGSFVENWKYYTIRPEGHNLYVVNPGINPGQNRYTDSEITIQEKKEKGVIYTVDMHEAYSGDLKEAKRGYMLTNDRNVFVLQDEIVPYENSYDDFYWFWHTYADIEIDNENKIVTLKRENKKVRLYFDCSTDIYLSYGEVKPLASSPAPDGQLQSEVHKSMKKITAQFFGNGEPITLRVIAEPDGQSCERGEIIPIAEWSVPDGSTNDYYYAKASDITINGEKIDGFSPDCYEYTVNYPLSKGIPVVDAKSYNGVVTVKQAEYDGDIAVVRIESKENPGNFKIYTVTLTGQDDTLTVTNTYVDCDFESYTELTGNKSDKNFFIYHNRGGWATFVNDNQRKSKVLNYNVQSAKENGCTLDLDACIHMDQNITYGSNIVWNGAVLEFSFKLDTNARVAATMFGVPFVETGRDGHFYGINGTEKIKLGKYTLNEWHNVKVVFDRVEQYNGSSRVYVYVDGRKFMKTADSQNSDAWQCSYINAKGFVAAEARFTIYCNQEERYNLCLDDVKLYTTKESPFGKIDLDTDLKGTDILAQDYAVGINDETARKEIYVSEGTCLSDLSEKLQSENYESFDFYRNGEVVDLQNYSTTLAAGTTIYVPGNTKKIVMPYDLVSGKNAYSAQWQLYGNGKKVSDIAEIKNGDELTVSAEVENLSTVDKNNTVILAVYDGDRLAAVVREDFVALSQLKTEQTMKKSVKVPDGTKALTVKAFVMDSIGKLKPLTSAFELK